MTDTTSTDIPTDAEIANAINELEKMQRHFRVFDQLGSLLKTLVNRVQVSTELQRRIDAKRDEIAQLEQHTLDEAKAAAQKEADAIVADAQQKGQQILADARAAGASVHSLVDTLRGERDALRAEIATLKQHAASLAG